jgi:hypothetical protein
MELGCLGHGLGQYLGHGIGLFHGPGHAYAHISTCINTPLEEEEKPNTHLTSEATFIYCTYPLFIMSPT